jgi:hypothetical protein
MPPHMLIIILSTQPLPKNPREEGIVTSLEKKGGGGDNVPHPPSVVKILSHRSRGKGLLINFSSHLRSNVLNTTVIQPSIRPEQRVVSVTHKGDDRASK